MAEVKEKIASKVTYWIEQFFIHASANLATSFESLAKGKDPRAQGAKFDDEIIFPAFMEQLRQKYPDDFKLLYEVINEYGAKIQDGVCLRTIVLEILRLSGHLPNNDKGGDKVDKEDGPKKKKIKRNGINFTNPSIYQEAVEDFHQLMEEGRALCQKDRKLNKKAFYQYLLFMGFVGQPTMAAFLERNLENLARLPKKTRQRLIKMSRQIPGLKEDILNALEGPSEILLHLAEKFNQFASNL